MESRFGEAGEGILSLSPEIVLNGVQAGALQDAGVMSDAGHGT